MNVVQRLERYSRRETRFQRIFSEMVEREDAYYQGRVIIGMYTGIGMAFLVGFVAILLNYPDSAGVTVAGLLGWVVPQWTVEYRRIRRIEKLARRAAKEAFPE